MDRRTAAALLGVDPDSPPELVTARYRSLLMQAHPDRSSRPDAAERTMRLTAAYRVLRVEPQRPAAAEPESTEPKRTEPTTGETGPASPDGGGPSATGTDVPAAPGAPTLLGPTTIGLDLPEPVALRRLLDLAVELGEVTYLDRSAGLIEVVVEFVDAPTSSVVLTVVGHPGGSRVDCWVEPLSGGPAPPSDAVTRLLMRELRGDSSAD